MNNSLTEKESKTLEAIRKTDLSSQRRLPAIYFVVGMSFLVVGTGVGIAIDEALSGATNGAWACLLCVVMSKTRSGYNHLYSLIQKLQ